MNRRSSPPILLLTLLFGCGAELPREPPAPDAGSPKPALQQIADELRARAGTPGALLGVAHGDQRFLIATGHEDLLGLTPLSEHSQFRAGSITKLMTGALVLRAVEQGKLRLEDTLDHYVPAFPNAAAITVDMLLSHTGGVTTTWFDQPALQAELTADLSRNFAPMEVIERLAREPAAGAPGESGMQYSNLDFVLLGQVLQQAYGAELGALLERELFAPLQLGSTSYRFDAPPALMSGYFEFMGLALDATVVPQTALLSFAGAAGAVHSNLDDLLRYLRALFGPESSLLNAESRARMAQPAEPGSWYGRAAMRFCPCDSDGEDFRGIGHGGNLPGYWSVAVYYPALDLAVVIALNRDSVGGVPIERSVFDPSLAAVVAAFAP